MMTNQSEVVTRASSLPIVFSTLAILTSLTIYFIAGALETNLVYYLGYLLTPLVVFACVAWDSISQRTKSRDVWFSASPKKSLLVRVLAGIALIPAVLHIIQLGNLLGQRAVQEGWLS